jgi:DNA-binding transcriptional LysR family regulator
MICALQAAEHGSFAAAAKVLRLTPAAVGKNIATLEGQLEFRLFNRTTRSLSLTQEGHSFLANVGIGLRSLESAANFNFKTEHPSGLVRVSAPVGFGRRFIVPHLSAFFALAPEVQVELNLDDRPIDIVSEGFDLGVRGGRQPPEGMVSRKICDIPLVLVASPGYLKRRGTPKTFRDLQHHDVLRVKFLGGRLRPWLFRERVNGRNVVSAYQGNPKLLISDPEVIVDAALAGLGIAGMGRHHAHEFLKRGTLAEVLPHEVLPGDNIMSIFFPHRRGLAPRVRVFMDFLLRQLADEPALHA